jgi:hypothetical protein
MGALPEIVRGNPALGENFFHLNTLPCAFRKPGFSFPKATTIRFGHGFIIVRSRGDCAGDGIDHYFQKMADRCELTGIQLVEQLVCVLSIHAVVSFVFADALANNAILAWNPEGQAAKARAGGLDGFRVPDQLANRSRFRFIEVEFGETGSVEIHGVSGRGRSIPNPCCR